MVSLNRIIYILNHLCHCNKETIFINFSSFSQFVGWVAGSRQGDTSTT